MRNRTPRDRSKRTSPDLPAAAEPPSRRQPATRPRGPPRVAPAAAGRPGPDVEAGCGKDAVPQARARPAYAARRYSTNAMTNAAPSPAGAEPGHEPGAPTGAPGGPPRALRPAGTRVFPAVTHRGAYRYL